MTRLENVERWRLQETVSQIEAAMANGAVTGDAAALLTRFLENAKRRIEALETSEVLLDAERRSRERQDLAIAMMIQRETALTYAEQQQYGSFLASEFFTRSDFGALEQFYAGAWDRLSKEGKAEMSHRIWEGIRRDEYDFSELPDIVKQKEAQRLHELLSAGIQRDPGLSRIPESDRRDFIDAWKDGRRDEAYQILDRPSFAENVALNQSTGHTAKDGRDQFVGTRSDIAVAEERGTAKKSNTPFEGLGAVNLDADILSSLDQAAGEPEVPIPGGLKGDGKGR